MIQLANGGARMIQSLGLLLVCQLVGEALVRAEGLPLPGPVLGMVFLFLVLLGRDRMAGARWAPAFLRDGGVEATGKVLLANLSLLFVPAGVGVIRNLDVFAQQGVALAVALVVSTLLTLLVAVGAFRLVSRAMGEA